MPSLEETVESIKSTAADLEKALAKISGLERDNETLAIHNDELKRTSNEALQQNTTLRVANAELYAENDGFRVQERTWQVERDSFLRFRAEVGIQLTNAQMALADAQRRIEQADTGEPVVPVDFDPAHILQLDKPNGPRQ